MILFFDTETNGLWRRDLKVDHEDQPHMVSMAAQLCDMKEKVVGQMAFRMKPSDINFIIPKDVEEIHGISTKEAERTGIPTRIALELFKELLEKTDILVAHNTAFDLQIIERAFNEFGIKYKLPKLIYCTMMMAKNEMKLQGKLDDYKFPKLEEMYKHFLGGGYHNWHDALTDIIICRILYFHMKAKGIKMEKPRDIPTALIKNLDEKKYKEFEILLKSINSDSLNDWEKQFLKDQKERYEKYKEKILVSEKQMNILRKLV